MDNEEEYKKYLPWFHTCASKVVKYGQEPTSLFDELMHHPDQTQQE